ncbi:putative phage abortive infection protein [Vibrio vulnificus]|uniref:putative phage abortive infection protein n=1 Tax=Vibrio TaxID=662 RepID=UPI00111E0203|nr:MULTISPECIES: putative phage abortive infection protein [Vibrio]EIN6343186.1 putative phage abortive infection protein [Vibrio parahaemolyticus]MCA3899467.1 putative phage abortive infection protein [Vibrio vulnificus]TOB86317.1 hypothetical protein CGJ95_22940 [Vibrio parahaemolyticus]
MKAVGWIVLIAIVASLFALGTFIDNFGMGYWDSVEKWAQTGDFFGGVLNPIFAFLSLILIAYTLTQNKQALVQSRKAIEQSEKALTQNELALKTGNEELKLSRIEFGNSVKALNSQVEQFNSQRFENTFFNMLTLQNDILNNISFNNDTISPLINMHEESTNARAAFSSILRWIRDDDVEVEGECQSLKHYNEFQVTANQVVGHYFRNLYQIIKFIDESELVEKEKQKYARMLRAQLSSDEIALLFFNCLSSKVDNGQFRCFVIEYRMLEHLTVDPYFHAGFARISTQSIYVPEDVFSQYVVRNLDGDITKSAFGTNTSLKKFSVQKI